MENKDLYFVAVKVFLKNKEGQLLITKDIFNNDWDIPGGRLRKEDFTTPLPEVIVRKIKEELGDISYKLGEPKVFMRHEREEHMPDGSKATRRIFAVGYEAQYLGGEIKLGKHHEKYEWVDLKTFKPEGYFTGGWLAGVKEYMKL